MKIARILLVDDDSHIRRIGELALSKIGNWEVLLAESGAKALEMCAQIKPDVILLDVMMPAMDGPATLKLIQQQEFGTDIPVIFMTAKVLKHELDGYRDLGAAGIIPKPFNPLTLPLEIKSIVAEFACRQELCQTR